MLARVRRSAQRCRAVAAAASTSGEAGLTMAMPGVIAALAVGLLECPWVSARATDKVELRGLTSGLVGMLPRKAARGERGELVGAVHGEVAEGGTAGRRLANGDGTSHERCGGGGDATIAAMWACPRMRTVTSDNSDAGAIGGRSLARGESSATGKG